MNAPFSLFSRNNDSHHALPMLHSNNLFALGREIRIMVKPEEIDDLEMIHVSRSIAKKIEEELEYPGQIKINVIRETRAIEYAK